MKKYLILLLALAAAAGLAAQETRDPWRALAYSAVFPGGGQIYNQSYLKAGLVIGLQAFLIGSAVYHDDQRAEYRALSQAVDDPYLQQEYLERSKDYRDKLNNDVWWIGITAGLSMIDAYVDAHLYDFDSQKEKLRLRFENGGVALQYRF